jgi:hypothetical protein
MNMASFIVVHSTTICQPTKESESASQIKSNSLKLSPPRTKHLSHKEHHHHNNDNNNPWWENNQPQDQSKSGRYY